jgi:hypothetical protein
MADVTSATSSITRFPFWLIYELSENEIVVLALWHHQSQPEDWSQRGL